MGGDRIRKAQAGRLGGRLYLESSEEQGAREVYMCVSGGGVLPEPRGKAGRTHKLRAEQ